MKIHESLKQLAYGGLLLIIFVATAIGVMCLQFYLIGRFGHDAIVGLALILALMNAVCVVGWIWATVDAARAERVGWWRAKAEASELEEVDAC